MIFSHDNVSVFAKPFRNQKALTHIKIVDFFDLDCFNPKKNIVQVSASIDDIKKLISNIEYLLSEDILSGREILNERAKECVNVHFAHMHNTEQFFEFRTIWDGDIISYIEIYALGNYKEFEYSRQFILSTEDAENGGLDILERFKRFLECVLNGYDEE